MDADTLGDLLQLGGATIATLGLTRGIWKGWSTFSNWTPRLRRPELPPAPGPIVQHGTDKAGFVELAVALKTDTERFIYLSGEINKLSRRLTTPDDDVRSASLELDAQLADLRRDIAAATKWERRAALAGAALTIAGMAIGLLC
ncbi:hypothetical protein [Nocardia salmonicida]|uniref:hypothetical protein n=1 Tax=Nocardia salmonicida TaxID=53431 RepID=UPI0007A4A9DD|nr:hypothetical protein [Nocardia salmonicida]